MLSLLVVLLTSLLLLGTLSSHTNGSSIFPETGSSSSSASELLQMALSSSSAAAALSGDEKFLVLNLQKLGLANRLRSVADWYAVSRLVGRHLIVSWRATQDCNVHFHDLFEAAPPHMTVLAKPLPLDGDATLAFLEDALKEANISVFTVYGHMEPLLWMADGGGSFRLSEEFGLLPHRVVATSYDGIIAHERAPCQHYSLKHSETLRMFKPRAQFLEVVDGLMDQYFSSQILVAIHIRVHDPIQDWEVVPPGFGEQFAGKFGDGATISDFHKTMALIEKHFGCGTEAMFCPVRFFIASNSKPEKEKLLAHFPNAISINCELSRESYDGVQCAFIEWLVISRAGLIIHTYGSSFAEEASQVHMRPLISIWQSRLVHHRNIFLPFCGQMQYAKYFSTRTVATVFTEGTTDKRQVKGGLVSLEYCNQFLHWGLEDVYCIQAD